MPLCPSERKRRPSDWLLLMRLIESRFPSSALKRPGVVLSELHIVSPLARMSRVCDLGISPPTLAPFFNFAL